MPFRSLDPAKIIVTAELLERRVQERFPDRGLAQVARRSPPWHGASGPRSRS